MARPPRPSGPQRCPRCRGDGRTDRSMWNLFAGERCATCEGRRVVQGALRRCVACRGSGRAEPTWWGGAAACAGCAGRGFVRARQQRCGLCAGAGRRRRRRGLVRGLSRTCPACLGCGVLEGEQLACPWCKGDADAEACPGCLDRRLLPAPARPAEGAPPVIPPANEPCPTCAGQGAVSWGAWGLLGHEVCPSCRGMRSLEVRRRLKRLAPDDAESDDSTPSGKRLRAAGDCAVCLARPADAVLVHAGSSHQCCCVDCAKEVVERGVPCPICRGEVETWARNFL